MMVTIPVSASAMTMPKPFLHECTKCHKRKPLAFFAKAAHYKICNACLNKIMPRPMRPSE
jgi:hypothetical protein